MFKMEIKGLDKLQNTLEEAERAAKAVHGEIGQLRFNPADPRSVEQAIAEGKAKVDAKLGRYSSNPIAKTMADALKQKIEETVREKAKAALQSGK
jgi:hypothetical protein